MRKGEVSSLAVRERMDWPDTSDLSHVSTPCSNCVKQAWTRLGLPRHQHQMLVGVGEIDVALVVYGDILFQKLMEASFSAG
jgi:hypothetical protein